MISPPSAYFLYSSIFLHEAMARKAKARQIGILMMYCFMNLVLLIET